MGSIATTTNTLTITDQVGDSGTLTLTAEDRATLPWGPAWAQAWFEGDPTSIALATDLADALSTDTDYIPDVSATEAALGITVRWADAA